MHQDLLLDAEGLVVKENFIPEVVIERRKNREGYNYLFPFFNKFDVFNTPISDRSNGRLVPEINWRGASNGWIISQRRLELIHLMRCAEYLGQDSEICNSVNP